MKYDSCIYLDGVGTVLTPLFPQWGFNAEWCKGAGIRYVATHLFSVYEDLLAKYKVFTLSKYVPSNYTEQIICQVYLTEYGDINYMWLIGFETDEESIIFHLTKNEFSS